jgi:hypothetical protein
MTKNLFSWLNDRSLSDTDRVAGALSVVLDLIYTQLNVEYSKDLDRETIDALADVSRRLEGMIQNIITKQNHRNWVNGNEP